MKKKLHDYLAPKDADLREKILRVILFAAGLMAFFGTIGNALVMDFKSFAFTAISQGLAVILAFVATVRYRKTGIAAMILWVILGCQVFPDMFFQSGGIEGGATVWFVVSIVYVFIMFSGKKKWFFLGVTIAIEIATYVWAYLHPEKVIPLGSQWAVYFDSIFAVMVVGLALGFIISIQMKQYEKERTTTLAQKEELERVSNTKNEFFANMSHEIRTPINTIVGLNEMILRESKEEQTREYAEYMQSASEMLMNLINDILDLSRMETQQLQIIPTEYRTRDLFGDLVAMTEVEAHEKGLEFIIDVDEKLPRVLYGDEQRIKQIFLNILSNAIKYTQEGSITLTAHGEVTGEGALLLKVSVADTGIGIRKEDLEGLYDAFNRVDEWKNAGIVGSGLGLAITKQLLDLMGGEITVDSIYTKGSVFAVTIKQKIVDATPIGKAGINRRKADRDLYVPTFKAPEASVLVVDDNQMNALVVSKLLGATNMQVDIAESGAESLEKTKQKYYHIILMDYLMPKMNGAETLREIRRQENGLCRDSTVIVLTANSMTDAKHLCEEHGFDGYLEKPIAAQKLEAEVLNFLPEDIVEYRLNADMNLESQMRQIASRKKKKIYITSDCVCDLPEEMLEKYDISLMYLYIKTDKGRFADTREIDGDSLRQYLEDDSSEIYTDSVSVEEFENFFAETLTRAETVIHISMASQSGRSYGVATAAAQGFDHVKVVDSGHISGGEGMLVLYAAKLAQDGLSVASICAEIERVKGQVVTKIFAPSGRIFTRNSNNREWAAKICQIFNLHPVLQMKQSKMVSIGIQTGKVEHAWRRFIRANLKYRHKIDNRLVVITYVGCTVRQQEMIRDEVLKCVPFEEVIMQKASFSNACGIGIQSVAIAYSNKIL